MLNISNVSKKYDKVLVLDNVSLRVECGEIIALIGPSGSGKSTLLRCIIGIEEYQVGEIKIDIPSSSTVGMVFQNFNLFLNMTVLENLIYGPVLTLKISHKKAVERARYFLEKIGMLAFADKYPHSLSGGQKQRVAIARALCMKPELLLFDEPTSALDPESVKEVLNTIKDVALGNDMTALIATHEMQFAREIADKVIFLDKGKIIEYGNVDEIFYDPKSDRLKYFLDKVL